MSGKLSRRLRRLAAEASASGRVTGRDGISRFLVVRHHRDDGVSYFRGVRHRVYQELKRTWSSSRHHVAGTFTGDRDRPERREWREKVRSDYQRRMG